MPAGTRHFGFGRLEEGAAVLQPGQEVGGGLLAQGLDELVALALQIGPRQALLAQGLDATHDGGDFVAGAMLRQRRAQVAPAHGLQRLCRQREGLHNALADDQQHHQHQSHEQGREPGQPEQGLARAFARLDAVLFGFGQLGVTQGHDGVHLRHIQCGELGRAHAIAPMGPACLLHPVEQLGRVAEVALHHANVRVANGLGRGARLDPQHHQVTQLIDASRGLIDALMLRHGEGQLPRQGGREQGAQQPRAFTQLCGHAGPPDGRGQGRISLLGLVGEQGHGR